MVCWELGHSGPPGHPDRPAIQPAADDQPRGAAVVDAELGAQPVGGGLGSILPLLFIAIVAMLFFSILGQRRERKKREAMISAIKKHDRVQTIGGIIGSIVELKPDTVVLKVDESSNTRITFARSAIQQVIKSSPEITAG